MAVNKNIVGQADPENPRYNLTDSPYWTDGLPVVFVFSDQATALDQLEFFDWRLPQIEEVDFAEYAK